MLYHGYIGEYPRDREPGWSDNLQGVTHDDDNWFFTQERTLWKFPVTHDLNEGVSGADPARGILKAKMPKPLADQGYDHFGDLDCFEGNLFIPITGKDKRPQIAVFDAADLAYIGSAVLKPQSGAGWCAINPADRLLYTSNSVVEYSSPLCTYEVAFDQLRGGQERGGRVVLRFAGCLYLGDERGRSINLQHMQGGVFSNDGYLYTVNGYYTDFIPKYGGISVFEVATGKRVAKSVSGSGPFNYEFHPGWSKYEEPEGVTLWNLDDGRAPHIRGQLHVIMLDNDAICDDLYFKHYMIAPAPYVANKNSSCREVHKAECVWVGKMAGENKVPYLGLEEALGDGYDGCFYCLREYNTR